MQNTTIQISVKTRNLLDSAKKYRRETYNDVLNRVLEEAGYLKKEPKEIKGRPVTSTQPTGDFKTETEY